MKPTLNIIDYLLLFLNHLLDNKGSIIMIIIYIIIFLSILKFREIRDKREEIINNWPEYKCRPYIIPIAGHFKGTNFFKYTFENFNEIVIPMIELAESFVNIYKEQYDAKDENENLLKSIQKILKKVIYV